MKDFTKFHSDKEIAKYLISEFDNSKEEEIFSATKKIITECRKNKSGRTLLDKFLSEYGLTNDEGVALMGLAESILRIPDDTTKDELISEKITNSLLKICIAVMIACRTEVSPVFCVSLPIHSSGLSNNARGG